MLAGIIKIFFWGILPGIVVFFRFKKKINNRFTLGLVIFSFFISFLILSTWQTVKIDPVQNFKKALAQDNFEEAKRAYQTVVQLGPESISKVDKYFSMELSNFGDQYRRVKKACLEDYLRIAKDFFVKYKVQDTKNCLDLIDEENNLGYLKHALKLTDYAFSLGENPVDLKKDLDKKILKGTEIIKQLKEKCD